MNYITELLLLKSCDKMSKRYDDERYHRILQLANKLYSNNDRPAVYRNIFRILSLHKSDNGLWVSEYGEMLKKDQFKILGQNDNLYIRSYLHNCFSGKVIDEFEFELKKVSERTKKYFPMPKV